MEMMTNAQISAAPQDPAPAPWWSFAHVWMVIAGPAVVVIAGFITLYLAVRAPDPVLDGNYYQRGMHINQTRSANDAAASFRYAPAAAARNHAATGEMPASPAAAATAGAAAVAPAGGAARP
jgi:uncharacterized protein